MFCTNKLIYLFNASRTRNGLSSFKEVKLILEERDLAAQDLHLQLHPPPAAQVRVPRRRLGPRRLHHHRLLPHLHTQHANGQLEPPLAAFTHGHYSSSRGRGGYKSPRRAGGQGTARAQPCSSGVGERASELAYEADRASGTARRARPCEVMRCDAMRRTPI